jgi:hypothetical protein
VEKEWLFSDSPYFSQIPKDAQIIFIVQGALQAERMNIAVKGLNTFQKLPYWWSDFLTYEPLTVYSINLRYGQKLLGTSIVQRAYWISIIGLVVLIIRRKAKLQNVLLVFGTVFLFLTIRNTRDYGHIVVDEIKGFKNQNFPVVGEMYEFVKGGRAVLGLDE